MDFEGLVCVEKGELKVAKNSAPIVADNICDGVVIYAIGGNANKEKTCILNHVNVADPQEFFYQDVCECRNVYVFRDYLIENFSKEEDQIYVGMIFGIAWDSYYREPLLKILSEGMTKIVERLKYTGYDIELLEDLCSHLGIVDPKAPAVYTNHENLDNGEICFDNYSKPKKIIKKLEKK